MKKFLVFVLLFFFAENVFGQGPSYNEEFQVNTFTTQMQVESSIAVLKNENFVVCWRSDGQGSGYGGVYAQLFSKNYVRIGEEFQVNTYNEAYQHDPQSCSLLNGDFVICWSSSIQDEDSEGIYAQLFNQNGIKIGDEFRVNSYIPNNQSFSSISNLIDGGFIICWKSLWQDGSKGGIYAQVFNENGIKRGTEFRVNSYIEDDQSNPSVTSLHHGGFVITWESVGQDSSGTGIFALIFDSSGNALGNEFLVNTNTSNWQYEPHVSVLNDGGFVITWTSNNQDGSYEGIYAQIYYENGDRNGEEFKVNTYSYNRQMNPTVSGLKDGNFIIAWSSWGQDGSGRGVYSQIYNKDGYKVGSEFRVNSQVVEDQDDPSIAQLDNETVLICWQSWGDDGDFYSMFGKYFLPDPILQSFRNFDLNRPSNGDTLRGSIPDFVWQKANKIHVNYPWEFTYELHVSKEEDFNQPTIITGIQDTSYHNEYFDPFNSYFWKILAKNLAGDSLWSSSINRFTIDPNAVVGINIINPEIPESFKLFQNYPNPFNPITKIKFTIATSPLNPSPYQREGNRERFITLKVYDILGNEIVTLVNEQKSPGTYEVEFNSEGLTSGIYFYKLNAGSFSQTKKMLLMK